jgi:hypothetical protein
VELRLHENLYGITRGAGGATGKIAVAGDQITFYASTICDGTGLYSWSISEGKLTFVSVEPDPCGGRAEVLDGISYTAG